MFFAMGAARLVGVVVVGVVVVVVVVVAFDFLLFLAVPPFWARARAGARAIARIKSVVRVIKADF
jgi:hypothetical protein